MTRRKHTMLIAGASGVVGAAATEHFAALPDWEVLALSRRPCALPLPLEARTARAIRAHSRRSLAAAAAPRSLRRSRPKVRHRGCML